MLLALFIFWKSIVVTIYAGEGGVLFKRWGGTVVDRVYEEGLYTIFPWDILTPYTLRTQQKRHEFDVLSKQGLTIQLKISIRFKPNKEMIGVLHKTLGPNYLDSVVIPEIESVIRRYFGKFNDDELYTSKKAILENILNDATKQLADKFIILDDLIIRKMKFPPAIQDSIQNKITQYHKFKAYEYKVEREKLEAKRKVIEAKGISQYKDLISKSITKEYLEWAGIQATLKLAESNNAKIVVIGSAKNGLPLILNHENPVQKNEKSQ
jgi:regulator of protease activity HflC (stomatin/prohibitin superfamily)